MSSIYELFQAYNKSILKSLPRSPSLSHTHTLSLPLSLLGETQQNNVKGTSLGQSELGQTELGQTELGE